MNEETTKKSYLTKIIKANRIAAWVLLFTALAYGITGFGMTKGLIDRELARGLHLGWLGIIGLLALVLHAGFGTYTLFKRHNIWNRYTQILMIIFYLLIIGFFTWLHFFYEPQTQTTSYPQSSTTTTIFTAEKLSIYNGQNGQQAYAAIDGVVYDLSRVFKNGKHHGYTAGQDLSAAFHNEHSNNILKNYPIVGSYKY